MSAYHKHLVIVGTARSGTSWLSETIARQHRYRMLFEPEHETRTPKGSLLCDQWLQSKADSKEAHSYLKDVFKNRVDCDWIAQNSNRKFKRHLWPFVPKKYIIKFVRANLLAKYVNESFEIPVIHMIRNPYDVLKSQQRANFPWLTDLSRFASQPALTELIQTHFNFDIRGYDRLTRLEQLTLRWCIENVIPLEVLEPYQFHSQVIRYEDLFSDLQVFYQLCHDFKLKPVDNIEHIYALPSTKTHHKSRIKTKEAPKVHFSVEEFRQINDILDAFRTKLYPRNH